MSPISDAAASSGRLRAPELEFRSKGDGGRPWRVRRVVLEEALSARFSATVDLDHEDEAAEPEALFGTSAVLALRRPGPGGSARRFCGVVRAVDEAYQVGVGERRRCRVKVEPAFFCLEEEIDTRPFVGLTVPEILRELLTPGLDRFGGRALELRLQRPSDDAGEKGRDGRGDPRLSSRRYGVRELCVQYGESTYDFCRRLMAVEGMTYFFDHAGDVEKMVVVDEAQFERAGAPLRMLPATGLTAADETIAGLTRVRARTAGAVSLKPFDHLDPGADWNRAGAGAPSGGALDHRGIYDARPGVTFFGYDHGRHQRSDTPMQTEVRSQQEAAGEEILRGTSDVVGLTAGHFLTIADAAGGSPSPSGSWGAGEFLVAGVSHWAEVPEAMAADQEAPPRHENSFTLVPRRVAFRPAPLPRPQALQDWALVLSAFEHDPIDTDRHGRVRVRFLYDGRHGVGLEGRSCWVPVSQPWVGAGYGVQVIPRAGMLARVEYIFGDPDRPVVVECFPGGPNRVPAALPEQKTRLTLRSKSLRDRGRDSEHFNEVALDDAAEREQVFLRAGHDLRRKVLNDDRTETLHDEAHQVGNDQELGVKQTRTTTVHGGETATVLGSRRTTIEADDEHAVVVGEKGAGGKEEETVDGARVERARSTRTTTIAGLERGGFGAGRDEKLEGEDRTHVSGLRQARADVEWKAAQGKTSVVLIDGNATGHADGQLEVATKAAQVLLKPEGPATFTFVELQLVCGQSRITIGKQGLKLKSPHILVRGAEGSINLDARGATTAAKAITASAVMVNELKGPLVFISDTPGAAAPLAPSKNVVENVAGREEQLRLAQPDEETLNLEVTLLGHDLKPAAGVAYTLRLPTGELFQGATDGGGKLRETLPGVARTAEVSYEPAPGAGPICRTLALVDDDSDAAPVEQLRQLGFGDATSSAEEVIREFQGLARLEETGRIDDDTKQALAAMRSGRGLESAG